MLTEKTAPSVGRCRRIARGAKASSCVARKRRYGAARTRRAPAKLQRGLEHFAARHAMNIEGLGESLIARLIADGLIASYADVYRLTPERLEQVERMGKKSASTRSHRSSAARHATSGD